MSLSCEGCQSVPAQGRASPCERDDSRWHFPCLLHLQQSYDSGWSLSYLFSPVASPFSQLFLTFSEGMLEQSAPFSALVRNLDERLSLLYYLNALLVLAPRKLLSTHTNGPRTVTWTAPLHN